MYIKSVGNNYIKFQAVFLTILFIIFMSIILNDGINLKFVVEGTPEHAQLFYDWGNGYSEFQSHRVEYENSEAKLKFRLRGINLNNLRFDPVESEGKYFIKELWIETGIFPAQKYNSEDLYFILKNINMPLVELKENFVEITTIGNDPVFEFEETFANRLFKLLIKVTLIKSLISMSLIIFICFLLNQNKVKNYIQKNLIYVEMVIEPYRINWNYKAFIVSVFHFFISFWFQHLVFVFDKMYLKNIIICQILFYFLLLYIWHKVFSIMERVIKGEQIVLEYFKYVFVYFLILLFVLILLWPGYFVSDEWIMIYGAKRWQIASAYHFLIMLQLILSMMLIPAAAGIEIIQAFIISLVVGYVIFHIAQRVKNKKWIWILYIPLLYPAVLLNNFQLQKGMPGTYIEIFLLSKMIFAIWDNRKLNIKDLVGWIILTSITLTLRMEGIYYIIVAPIVLLVSFKNKMPKYFVLFFMAGIIFFSSTLNIIQNKGVGNFYTIVNLNRLIYAPIKVVNLEKDNQELNNIGKVVDVDIYLKARNVDEAVGKLDPRIFFSSDKDVSLYKRGALILTLKHFPTYFLQQLERFIMSSGFKYFSSNELGKFSGDINNYQNADIYELNSIYGQYLDELFKYSLDTPINNKVRMSVINFMQGRSMDEWNKVLITAPIFGNLIIPIIFLLITCIYLTRRKKYKFLAVLILFMLRLPMLFGLATYVSFQYYLRIFLIGNYIPWIYLFFKMTKQDITD